MEDRVMATGTVDVAALAGRIEEAAVAQLNTAQTAADVSAVMTKLAALAEDELGRALGSEEKSLIACRGGCAACCTVNVAVLIPEAIAIAGRVLACPAARRNEVCGRIDELYAKIRWMDDEERVWHGYPCAFLDGCGLCSIYPVRPLVCRALTSADPEQCRRALASRGQEDEEPVMMNLAQKFLMDEAFRSVARALERLGMDFRSMELTGSVRGFIAHPDLVVDFLAGRRISADARFDRMGTS
jgi:Fe-S-cluster containining protein